MENYKSVTREEIVNKILEIHKYEQGGFDLLLVQVDTRDSEARVIDQFLVRVEKQVFYESNVILMGGYGLRTISISANNEIYRAEIEGFIDSYFYSYSESNIACVVFIENYETKE